MKKWIIYGGAGVALVLLVSLLLGWVGSDSSLSNLPVAEVQRGDLVIDVLEGGNIEALRSLEIRNRVRASDSIKILEIVEEGYRVTKEDVEKGKVLVRLDHSAIEQRLIDQDADVQRTAGELAEATQGLEISESKALSEIKAERQTLRFALLDFKKYLGSETADKLLLDLGLPTDVESLKRYEQDASDLIMTSFGTTFESAKDDAEVNAVSELSTAIGGQSQSDDLAADPSDSLAINVNFDEFIEKGMLGDGEAEQQIRQMRDKALLSASELSVVEESVAGARRLHQSDFITRQTLDNELVGLDKARLALQTSETELDLFQNYEFPKEGERLLSAYEEALLSLIRAKREKVATMSQAYAKYQTVKARYEIELLQQKNLREQLEFCTIRAEEPGLIAYGGAGRSSYASWRDEGIAEGSSLRNGQPILTIPDMNHLGVKIGIHESQIKKVKVNQLALITADSLPGVTLRGRVSSVAVLPDSNASRYNPSLKVYPSTVNIEGRHSFLKPGMTAKVEIVVDELSDVLFVPVQAVFTENNERFVFLKRGSRYRRHLVEVGQHNASFIEIQSGLEEGDEVILATPADYEPTPLADPGSANRKKESAEPSPRKKKPTSQKPDRDLTGTPPQPVTES